MEAKQDVGQELRDLAREYSRHRRALARLEPRRDELIRSALKAGIPRRQIVEWTGLSPQRIDQIRRSARV